MLELADVGVRFGDKVAVADVSLVVPEGQVLAVLGPSGCGKSTLLRAIAGLEELSSGRVVADGADLAGVPTHRRGFALMFQDGQLFRHLDVAGNVGYPLKLRGRTAGPPTADRARRLAPSGADRARRFAPSAVTERVEELLATVGLPGYGAREVSTLSGGEQQRVALARALAAEPRLLLLDEPLSALDRSLRERLAGDLRGILTRTGTTALLVTHDHDEAFTLADTMALMFDGRIVQHGPTQEVWTQPTTRQVAEFIGFGTFLEGEAAERILAAASAAEPDPTSAAVRPDARDVTLSAAHGAHHVTRLGGVGTGQVLALRRSALRLDSAGSLTGAVVAAAGISDAVRVELDLEGVGRVEALADQNAVLRPGDVVPVRPDPAGMALIP